MDDNDYWNEYYLTHFKPIKHSVFAEYILPRLDKNKTILELGCGNGGDIIYFFKNDLNVVGVDQVGHERYYLNENFSNEKLNFVCEDFTNLSNSNHYLINNTEFDYIYSRFSFHSINEKNDDRTLYWIKNHLKDGLFLLEARSIMMKCLKKVKI